MTSISNLYTINVSFPISVTFYVDRLISEGVHDVIPKYVLHLPDRLREYCYLRLLRSLRDVSDSERRAIIEAAQKEDIAIYDYLTKFVYESIHKGDASLESARRTTIETTTRSEEMTEQDAEKIDALKWLFVRKFITTGYH